MLIKSCCNWTHSTISGEYNWGEGGILYFPDALLICSLFFFFMSAVASIGCGCGVRRSKWVKNSDIKNVFSKWPPQKPSTDLAPMSVMVEASLKVSRVTGCRVGSIVTL